MKETIQILLVGIGGYGALYTDALLDHPEAGAQIAGVVEPFPQGYRRLDELKARGTDFYPSMEAFFAAGKEADLTVISAPIHFHAPMIRTALANGSNVLCEKPLCGDAKEIDSLIAARDKAGKFVAIGYQWSFSEAIGELKKDILSGLYGAPRMLKAIALWPRNEAYYKRTTGWAGKRLSPDGAMILDSIANNAVAHHLHNILFVLGESPDRAIVPETVQAQLFRANPIEMFDTALIRLGFPGGGEALFVASHAVEAMKGPDFDYQFEKGRVTYTGAPGASITGVLTDGTVRNYGDPEADYRRKLWLSIEAARTGNTALLPCVLETSSVHTRIITALDKNVPIVDFPEASKVVTDDKLTYVKGLSAALNDCYKNECFLDGGAPAPFGC